MVQLALVVAAAHFFRIEEGRGFVGTGGAFVPEGDPFAVGLLTTAAVAFVVHALLPFRFRLPFFLLFSVAAFLQVMGWRDGTLLLLIGLGLVGLCHLPVPFRVRVGLVLLAGVVLGLVRGGVIEAGFASTVLPVLGSVFMFRMMIYLYDLRYLKVPACAWQRLSYFFLAPNVCFPLFPVVDYSTFVRNYYDGDELRLYQKGVHWMSRGVLHLLGYRLVYYYLSPAPGEVTDLGGVVAFVFSSYLLYLRISGQFHIIVGLLCLFGFNLPETHHRYLLASGFNDYWRRINIYWKDFMMKLIFYPCFMRCKKLGIVAATCLAAAAVFVGTWFLHSYQWFWLRGTFHFSVVDALFWGIFGVLVIINSVYQLRKTKKPVVKGAPFSPLGALRTCLQVAGMFVLMCLLWAFWQSNSIAEYWAVLAEAKNATGFQVAALVGAVVAAVGIGFGALWLRHRGLAFWDRRGEAPLWQTGFATAVPMALLCLIGAKPVFDTLDANGLEVVRSLKGGRLNERDRHALERGYYEGLLQRETFASELWEVRLEQAPDWKPLRESAIYEYTGDLVEKVLVPNMEANDGKLWKTNRWGMRDRDYEKQKPPGTFRIALVGASYPVGAGVSQEHIFEQLVEDRLNRLPDAGFDRYQILNFSVPSYTLIELVSVNEMRIAEFEPDAMFFISHPNEGGRTMGTLARRMVDNVPLTFDYLEGLYDRAELTKGSVTRPETRRLLPFKAEIETWGYERMVSFCRERGILPVWVYLPNTDDASSPEQKAEYVERARAAGFVTIVLDDAYQTDDPSIFWVSDDDHHPNADGHEKIADSLFRAIVEKEEELGMRLGVNPQ